MARRLTAANAIALKAFWDAQLGGTIPFYFYFFIEGGYDPTGNSPFGRYRVVFRGSWSQSTMMQRTDVRQIELIEVA